MKSVDHNLLDQEFVSEEIENYSRTASRLGFIGAAAAMFVTRNPIIPLAVLLAANPRPITTSAEYSWKQAEHMARENNETIPQNGSLYQLTEMKAVVFEDASLISVDGTIRKECIHLFTLLKGKKVAFINNELDINLDQLNKNLKEFQITLISHQDLQLHIKRREDVLVIIKDDANEKNKVISFYPSCTFAQLNSICKNDAKR